MGDIAGNYDGVDSRIAKSPESSLECVGFIRLVDRLAALGKRDMHIGNHPELKLGTLFGKHGSVGSEYTAWTERKTACCATDEKSSRYHEFSFSVSGYPNMTADAAILKP
jgi:hypothetical protein